MMLHLVSFFKRILTGLNSELSFSETGYHTSVKESSLPYYLIMAGGRILDSYLSHEYQCYLKCKQPLPGFELVLLCPFPTTVTSTPRTPFLLFYSQNFKTEKKNRP